MNDTIHAITLYATDWFELFTRYLTLSLASIGGAVTTLPEMHRYLVLEKHWLTNAQFDNSFALSQVAPGPNILFVALLGWQIGLNSGDVKWGLFGSMVAMTGMLLPSSLLIYKAAGWAQGHRDLAAARAFKQGMVPLVIGSLFASCWILVHALAQTSDQYARLIVLSAAAMLVVWRLPKFPLLILLLAGGVLGYFGWV